MLPARVLSSSSPASMSADVFSHTLQFLPVCPVWPACLAVWLSGCLSAYVSNSLSLYPPCVCLPKCTGSSAQRLSPDTHQATLMPLSSFLHTGIHTCGHTCSTHSHTCMHACMHAYTHTYILRTISNHPFMLGASKHACICANLVYLMSPRLHIPLSIHQSIQRSIHLSICPPLRLSIYLSRTLSLPVCLSSLPTCTHVHASRTQHAIGH